MNDQELSDYLSMLGYNMKWLENGLLTKELLSAQVHTFQHAEDKNPEHYRYACFRNYLADKERLTDEELARYIGLAMADEDRAIAGAALVDVFKTQLTHTQFHTLITQLEALGTWTSTVIARQILLRRLSQEVLTEALFEECFAQGDNVVQEYLIHVANREQLHILASKGRTKRIRSMALERLN